MDPESGRGERVGDTILRYQYSRVKNGIHNLHAWTPEISRAQLCRAQTGVAEPGVLLQGNGYGTDNEMRPAQLRLSHRSRQTSWTLLGMDLQGPSQDRQCTA